MLCKFTNTGNATRIIFDMAVVQRSIKPGVSIEVDLPVKQVKMFERAQTMNHGVAIERLEGEGAAAADAANRASEPKKTFTLRPEEGPQEPQSLKEALGHIPPRVEPATPEPEPTQRPNPIEDNADKAAEAPKLEEPAPGDPKDVGELIAAIEAGSLEQLDQIRLANRFLVKKVQKHASKTAILAALHRQQTGAVA